MNSEIDNLEHINFICIGHVDAGKSTLCGAILVEMGLVDKATIEKYKKIAKEKNRESWYLAYIMDTNEEERDRGKTVDIGKRHFNTEKYRYTLLDAPGHKDYVPAMISGASQADIAVLIISARKGEFESGFEKMGQTREHAMLAYTLGIKKLIVAVNKMDSVDWSQERYDEIVKKLMPFLKGCGFKIKKDVYFLPLSAYNFQNVKVSGENLPKWTDEYIPLISLLDSIKIEHRDENAPLRIPILYSYEENKGLYSLGKVEYGTLKTGQKLYISPNNEICNILSIKNSNDNEVLHAKPGENVEIFCQNVNINKGCVLSDVNLSADTFIATVKILNLLENKLFVAGYNLIIHVHTLVEECIINNMLYLHDPETGKPIKKKIVYAKVGSLVTCEIKINKNIAIEPNNEVLGRFTLRDSGKTIGIGKINKIISKKNNT